MTKFHTGRLDLNTKKYFWQFSNFQFKEGLGRKALNFEKIENKAEFSFLNR